MKKLLALLLSLLFVLSACTQGNNDSISGSVEPGDESAESSSDNSSDDTSSDKKKTVISTGALYQSATVPNETYSDSFGTELTDGVDLSAVDSYTDEELCAFYTDSLTITVDLGEECDKIYGFAVKFFASEDDFVSKKLTVNVTTSVNDVKYDAKAFFTNKDEVELGKVNHLESFSKNYIKARYVRFTIKGDANAIFLGEIEVIADSEPKKGVGYIDRVAGVYETLGVIVPPSDGLDVNRDYNKVLISKGYSYTFNFDASFAGTGEEGAPTKETVLTDGVMNGKYKPGSYISFQGSAEDATIKLDLGRETADVAEIQASFMSNPSARVYLPLAVKVTAIDANNNRTDLGVLYGTQIAKAGGFTFVLPLKKAVSARYIELTLTTLEGMSHFIEEISVYAFRDGMEQSTLYPLVEIEKGEASERDEVEVEYKNLILRQPQQIFMPTNGKAEQNAANNSPITDTTLTDGFYSVSGASPYDIHNGKFFKFNAGDIRYVIYDLKYLSAVDCFKGSFCKEISWGIQAPETVTVLLSSNGEDWYEAGSFALTATQYTGIVRGELKLDKPVQTRYVVFTIGVSQWVGCDELEVYGTEYISDSVTLADSGLGRAGEKEDSVGQRIEPSKDLLGGAKDLCLLYQISNNEGYTVEELLPYVAYLDKDAAIKDTMFDSFLFLYANAPMPSGAYPYQLSNMNDWQWVIDNLFGEGVNLNALEEVAGQVKSTLSLPSDFTYKITVSINYPNKGVTKFGDVDGDGVSEDLSVYANRMKVCKWFVDEVNRKFSEAGFKNIELVGYYWWHEQIDDSTDPQSEQLIKELADYIHSINYQFTWIPYFNANGYDRWKELGFDIACLQPNYVFNESAPVSNIYNCDQYTKDLGMGVEMEIDEPCLSDYNFFKRYMKYVSCGAELGYMDDTVLMYYQGFDIFYKAAYAENYFGRTIYDSTYHFIKGDLKNVPDTIVGTAVEGEANKAIFGKIQLPEDKMCELEIVSMPENGTVVIANDGSFTFYPAKDFKGETSFEFRYTELLSWSENCTVTVTVK